VTACSNETVLRAVATRARAALATPALDVFALLRSLGEGGKRYSFSNLGSLLHASHPILLFDPALAPRKNALFQAAAHGTAPEVAMLLSLSFAVGGQDERDQDFHVNEEDSQDNAPLLLTGRSGNLEIAEMLVCVCVTQETVVEEGTRDTMSLDAHDLPPDLELEPVSCSSSRVFFHKPIPISALSSAITLDTPVISFGFNGISRTAAGHNKLNKAEGSEVPARELGQRALSMNRMR
jgi:hypothetical protein